MKKIAVFASGAGSNAAKIIEKFKEHPVVEVALIICNKPGAGVLQIAEKNNIRTILIDKEKFFRGNGYVDELRQIGIDFIVLAGFLWKIPDVLIKAFPKKIINIHPALLPKHGGKGMYGLLVHQSVIEQGEKESGITIHYVDEHYDNGQHHHPHWPWKNVDRMRDVADLGKLRLSRAGGRLEIHHARSIRRRSRLRKKARKAGT